MHIFIKILKQTFMSESAVGRRIPKIIAAALILNVIAGVSFYFAERGENSDVNTLWDGLWWAMVTMTTVGYGDICPVTVLGRFGIAYPSMIIGIGIIGYLVGTVAEVILENVTKRRRGLMQIKEEGHIIICNCPRVEKAARLVDELRGDKRGRGREFVVISDTLEEIPKPFEERGIHFVKGDPTKEEVLGRANVEHCAGVFVLAEDPSRAESDLKTFATGTIIEMIERERGRPITVVVELVSKENLRMMRRTRVDGIVSAEGIIDVLMAQEYLDPGINGVLQQLLTNTSGSEFYIFETSIDGEPVAKISRVMLDHKKTFQLIGLIRDGEHYLNPDKDMKVVKGDKLIILAPDRSDIDEIESLVLNAS